MARQGLLAQELFLVHDNLPMFESPIETGADEAHRLVSCIIWEELDTIYPVGVAAEYTDRFLRF